MALLHLTYFSHIMRTSGYSSCLRHLIHPTALHCRLTRAGSAPFLKITPHARAASA